MLMTEHNLWFYQRLMQGLRDAIAGQRFAAHAAAFLDRYRAAKALRARSATGRKAPARSRFRRHLRRA